MAYQANNNSSNTQDVSNQWFSVILYVTLKLTHVSYGQSAIVLFFFFFSQINRTFLTRFYSLYLSNADECLRW